MHRIVFPAMRGLAAVAMLFVAFETALAPAGGYCEETADQETTDQQDKEWSFEVPAKGESKVYERPEKAEYFWWDTDDSVQVELVFDDGSKLNTGSSKEFSKRIVSVKFINPGSKPFPVKLWAQF